MNKLFLIALILLCPLSELLAVRAYPGLVDAVQPDGSTVKIQGYGDEFLGYTTDSQGYLVEKGRDGYYYYGSFVAGEFVLSSNRVGGRDSRSISVAGRSKYIPQYVRDQANALRERVFSDMAESSLVDPHGRGIGDGLMPTKGSRAATKKKKTAIVILVEFKDKAFAKLDKNSVKQDFDNLFNQTNYGVNGATGSVKDYFLANNLGVAYEFDFIVTPVVKLPQNMAFYGANATDSKDVERQQFVMDACAQADNAGVDFSRGDGDGDGVVDCLAVVFAGYNEAEQGGAETIWPHSWSIYNQKKMYDGKLMSNYFCTSELRGATGQEIAGVGTFCHEYAHVLGLWDMYDTDSDENGTTKGLGFVSLMSSGNYCNNSRTPPYLNLLERWQLGVCGLYAVSEGVYSLDPIQSSDGGYYMNSDVQDERFLIEYRDNSVVNGGVNWDKYIVSDRGEKFQGVLVYHLDYTTTARAKYWDFNKVNAYVNHPCLRFIPAAAGGVKNMAYPGTSNVTALNASNLLYRCWSGKVPALGVKNIGLDGSKMTLTIENVKTEFNTTYPLFTGIGASMSVGDKFTPRLINNVGSASAQLSVSFDGGEPQNKSLGEEITVPSCTRVVVTAKFANADGSETVVKKIVRIN